MTIRTVLPRRSPAGTESARPRTVRVLAGALGLALAASGFSMPAQSAPSFSVKIHSAGKGIVTGAGKYRPGDIVQLTAVPGGGQAWAGWSSPGLDWIGARVDSFTMPDSDVVLDTSFRPEMASLKQVYKDDFTIGNIYAGSRTYEAGTQDSATVARHYNIMTGENLMKPDQLLPNANINQATGEWDFTFANADKFVKDSQDRGIKVHGHVLVWHSQSPAKLTPLNRAQAKANMERYIETVLTHFGESTTFDPATIVSWDVVNEAFADGVDQYDPAVGWRQYLRMSSQWYKAYASEPGADPGEFIYDAFVFARKYAPNVKLEYNDFNVFQSEGKAKAIIAMATEFNQRYAKANPGDARLLIEGIGMQSHNYINQTPAFACSDFTRLPELSDDGAADWKPGACSDHASVERSIQLIIDAGLSVSVSELDVQAFEAWNAEPQGTNGPYYDLTDPSVKDLFQKPGATYWADKISNRAELESIQAQRFAEYFAVYKKYSQDVDRVTFWGLTDAQNWRRNHNPQIFNGDFSEKLAAVAVANPEGWLGLKKPISDTSRLVDAIALVDSLDLRGKTYTGKSIGAVNGARGKANAVISKRGTQAEVNAALATLLAAIDGLERR